MILFSLFFQFVKIGLFSFGGGYAAIPLIQDVIIYQNKWLTQDVFNDVLAISQMTPGPIGINAATFAGLQIASLPGAIAATLGFVFPSFILASILAILYKKYRDLSIIKKILNRIGPVVVAVILSAGIAIFKEAIFVNGNIDYLQLILFCVAIVLSIRFKLSPILIILVIGLSNLLINVLFF